MIKILFFIETLQGGGAEKVLCNLVNHMDPAKFDITVQTLWPAKIKLNDNIHMKSVYKKYSKINELRMRAEASLGITYSLHMKDDYDIECAYLESGTTKILAGSTNKGCKKVAWVHCDLMNMTDNYKEYAAKTSAYYKKYDKVVCVSENAKSSFDQMYPDGPKTVVIHNVIDDEMIRTKSNLPLPDGIKKDKFTIVTLGRLTAQKNYTRLLKTASQLLKEGLIFNLWILGEGEERMKLQQMIDSEDMQDSVQLLGFQKNPYPYIKAADCLVCSSDYEGYSTFITEGLILGKPIVTTECSGMRELVGDSEYGLITENEDAAFCQGLGEMIKNTPLRSEYGVKAKKRGTYFSMMNLIQENEVFFEDIINGI